MASAVPKIQFTTAGLVIPTEAAILSGVQADMDAAFGGGLNPALETPQGQLASSQAAVIGDKNNEIVLITNQIDPQYSDGRFQDAIGRIYFLTRKPAAATVVTATLGGAIGAIIPAGTLAQDTNSNTYVLLGNATIGLSGTVSADFQNVVTGPIPCAAGTLISVYQAVPGWDTITNPTDGTIGYNVESRAEFEYRRKNSVAINARGTPQAIYGEVFAITDVLDVYVIDNSNGSVTLTGAISGSTLTASNVVGNLQIGSIITGPAVSANTYITALGTGVGKDGTYTVNNSQTISAEAMTSPGIVYGATNYALLPHSLYVAVVGGLDADVAAAIWRKKDLGCDYNGNTVVTITDPSGYNSPQPSYQVRFERPTSLPIKFAVQILNAPTLPFNIVQLTQDAIIARFNGTDGTSRERIGSRILASRYYSAVINIAPGVTPVELRIGTTSATLSYVDVGIDQRPTITASDIAVTLV